MNISAGAKARLKILAEESGITNIASIQDDGTIITTSSAPRTGFWSFLSGANKTIGCSDVIMNAARGLNSVGDQSEVGKFKAAGAEHVLNNFSSMSPEIAINNLIAFSSLSVMPKVKAGDKDPAEIKRQQEEKEKKDKEAKEKKEKQEREQAEAKEKKEADRLAKQKEWEEKNAKKKTEKLPFSRITTDETGREIIIKEMMEEDELWLMIRGHIKAGGSIELIPA